MWSSPGAYYRYCYFDESNKSVFAILSKEFIKSLFEDDATRKKILESIVDESIDEVAKNIGKSYFEYKRKTHDRKYVDMLRLVKSTQKNQVTNGVAWIAESRK